jgi:hypothetical protein
MLVARVAMTTLLVPWQRLVQGEGLRGEAMLRRDAGVDDRRCGGGPRRNAVSLRVNYSARLEMPWITARARDGRALGVAQAP